MTATILLVEDEPAILKVAARILEAEGYRVLQASCARIALDLAERHDSEIALLITDVVMPDMNGADLARTLGERFPHVRLLYMSGYTPDVIAPRGVQADGAHFLKKPFTKSDLSTKVREALSTALVK